MSISVVFADYDKIKTFMKINVKMDPKSESKIDVWTIRGPTFEVLGGFLRSQIFDGFSIGEKSPKILKKLGLGLRKPKFLRF